MFHIAHDPHDLSRRRSEVGDNNFLPKRVFIARPITSRRRFTDDRDPRRVFVVLFVEEPAPAQRNIQRAKVILAYGVVLCAELFLCQGSFVLDCEAQQIKAAAEWEIVSYPYRLQLRQSAGPLYKLPIKGNLLLTLRILIWR